MHQVSTKMAESISPLHTKEVSEYIFSSFAEPAMLSFINKVSIKIPEVENMMFLQKIKVAKDISSKLGSEYKEHLQQSLVLWIKSLQNTHQSLQKRQDEMQIQPKPRKRLNTWGLLAKNNRGQYISGLVLNLITIPLWVGSAMNGWGALLAYTAWNQIILSPIWNRICFGSWM